METSSEQKKIVIKSKKDKIRELRRNIEALVFHITSVIIILAGLNIGLKTIGYDLISKLPYGTEKIVNIVIGVSSLLFAYWYWVNRLVLENAK